MAAAWIVQSDPAILHQLDRLATAQVIIAVSIVAIALSAIAIALGVLLGVRKLVNTFDRLMGQLTPKVDPLIHSATRIADDAEDVMAAVKGRVTDVLDTVEDINGRLKTGTQAIEERVKQFGAVVDVVQSEAEELLLDAASTARGVHTAADVLRAARRARLQEHAADPDEDVFTD